jgi:glyoxylase-like metal-dependent hydrolase (beta-lactamase superfamily II)
VLVEFADHLTLIEAPVDEARFNAIVAKAAELAPNKKITELVITHHHFDHLGGVRAAIAAGMTLYVRGDVQSNSANPEQGRAAPTLKPIKSFYEDIASRPHTIVPDALQKAPKTPVITEVGDKLVLGDKGGRTLELYPIVDSEYADTLLMAYLPKEKFLVEADVFTPPADIYNTLMLYPFVQNLIDNVDADKLKPEKILPLHGHIVPYAEMAKALAVRRQDPTAGNGATPQ